MERISSHRRQESLERRIAESEERKKKEESEQKSTNGEPLPAIGLGLIGIETMGRRENGYGSSP